MSRSHERAFEALRRDVERLTRRLLEVAAERAAVVGKLAAEKKAAGLPRRDHAREEELASAYTRCPPRPLTERSARRILDVVIDSAIEDLGVSLPRESSIARGSGEPVVVLGIGESARRAWILGPCSVESEEQLTIVARATREAGGRVLRGGAYKPRTSPQSFRGLGAEALPLLRRVADAHGLAVVTEATGVSNLQAVAEVADAVQIGSRNAQAFDFIDAVGRTAAAEGKAVLLKRGFGCSIAEWLSAAEYAALHTENIILCERGIRTFEPSTRFTLDVGAIPIARTLTRLPVVADASHAAGKVGLVAPLAAAALGAGADGVMMEVHPNPARALSDREQQIPVNALPSILADVRDRLARAVAW